MGRGGNLVEVLDVLNIFNPSGGSIYTKFFGIKIVAKGLKGDGGCTPKVLWLVSRGRDESNGG